MSGYEAVSYHHVGKLISSALPRAIVDPFDSRMSFLVQDSGGVGADLMT